MSDETEASVLGSLPHSRPQRRSDKRGVRPQPDGAEQPVAEQTRKQARDQARKQATNQARKQATDQARKQATDQARKRTAEQPPPPPPPPEPEQRRATCAASLADGAELVGTVLRASAELAEIGLTIGARTLRTALSRLPRP